jgi:hypothetical protein
MLTYTLASAVQDPAFILFAIIVGAIILINKTGDIKKY